MTRNFAKSRSVRVLSFVVLFAVLATLILPVRSASYILETVGSNFGENAEPLRENLPLDPTDTLLFPISNPVLISGTVQNSFLSQLFGEASEEEAALPSPEQDGANSKEEIGEALPKDEIPDLFPCPYQPTQEEYEMLLYCVDHETRSGSLKHRILIAEVVMNRVLGPKFGSTMKEILTKKGQFDVMVHWESRGDWVPKEDTVTAVNMVLSGVAPDYADGAVYFCNPYIVGEGNWFDRTLQVICEIEGHRFYKPY